MSAEPKPDSVMDRACKVCSGFGDMFKQINKTERPRPVSKQGSSTKTQKDDTVSSESTTEKPTTTDSTLAAATPAPTVVGDPGQCPEDYLSLGSKTWSFLHTVAAYYWPNPSQEDQTDMAEFIRLVGKFYPCRECGDHLQ